MLYADGVRFVSCCVSYAASKKNVESLLGQLEKVMKSAEQENKVNNIYATLQSHCVLMGFGPYDVAQTAPTCWISTLLCVVCQDLFNQGRADLYVLLKGPFLLGFIMELLKFSPEARQSVSMLAYPHRY